MTRKRIDAFLLLGAMLAVLTLSGCAWHLDAHKEAAIAEIDKRLTEIKASEPEYGSIVIEYEAEKAKKQIRNTTQGSQIPALTDALTEQIDDLLLSEDEMYAIKQACSVRQNGCRVSDDVVSQRQILYYLGKVGGYSVAIVKGDAPLLLLPAEKYYLIGYFFEYLPEQISLYQDETSFLLQEVYLAGNLTESDLALIYERFAAILAQRTNTVG